MPDTASDLMRKCNAAAQGGADFPTIWNTLLKPHPLVIGRPRQALLNGRTRLEISLMTGQVLVFDSSASHYSIG
ncbi:MAG: hypothetical protein IT539_00925 [Bradyrhizobiaceae bacterium]|nr:hypothetical protein [Bradyrhizobiaceae bacterium]